MGKPRLLDLFCGAGGCARGYMDAGFYVVGVDSVVQPRYAGDEFVLSDALALLEEKSWFVEKFDAIHASPPCQAHSSIAKQVRKLGRTTNEHPDLVDATRDLLAATGLPYVIENVVGAPLRTPVMLCGSSLGLDVRRHRLFETNWPLMAPPCAHGWQTPRFRSLDKRHKGLSAVVGVHGHLNYSGEREIRERAMDVDWMTPAELAQAIPPAMTELIGHQLIGHLRGGASPAPPLQQGEHTP
jgi:DNA (cytosine-5)-methyltransferase 1